MDYYEELFQNASDLIYTTDLQHRIAALNKAGEQLTGYTSPETVGKRIDLIVPAEYLSLLDQMRDRMIEGQPAVTYEIELLTRDGRRFPVEGSARLIYREGRPEGIQGILRDVTERKHLEKQLSLSQKMEAVGQLAGGVAHDFNNLLTIILGYTNLTIDSVTAKDPLYRNLEGIRKAVERASSLTRQLLAFSRRQVFQPRVLNLNEVIADLYPPLTRLLGEHIELITDLNGNIGYVKADPGQIEEVLMNLLLNSRNAMPNGGCITVRTSRAELTAEDASRYRYVHPGHYVLIEVEDTGNGMDAETLSRMYEPFFTTREAGKGTGLGLAMVYGIVKQSGGYIWATSEPGKGTTFQIYLPLAAADSLSESRASGKPQTSAREVILLVEDEEDLRILLRHTLENAGYFVLEAADGSDALRVADEHQGSIDAVVTDMVMPRLDGRSLAERLAQSRPDTPVLFMSGYPNDAVIRREGLESSVHFIQKPFEPGLLTGTIRGLLERKMAP